MISRAFLLVCLTAGSSAFNCGHDMVGTRSLQRPSASTCFRGAGRVSSRPMTSLRMSSDPSDAYSDAAFMVAPVEVTS